MSYDMLISIALAGIAAGLSAWIASLLVPDRKSNKIRYNVIFVFLLIVALSAKTALMNEIRQQLHPRKTIEQEVDEFLATNTVYNIIVTDNPEK
ncbi:hypothetical protein V6C53_07140 [Desulfocurvibacter africanus]|uniref:hypothetical protein n=1 Tax=Desulfocurvibacter africanus TaxID=873 RepID=UPI002FDA07CD